MIDAGTPCHGNSEAMWESMTWQKESSCGQICMILEMHDTRENFFPDEGKR
jgi:hypothetical protein